MTVTHDVMRVTVAAPAVAPLIGVVGGGSVEEVWGYDSDGLALELISDEEQSTVQQNGGTVMATDPLGAIAGGAIAFPGPTDPDGARVLDLVTGEWYSLDIRAVYPSINMPRLLIYAPGDGYWYVYGTVDTTVVGADRWRAFLWRYAADGSAGVELAEYAHSARIDPVRISATHLAVGRSSGFTTRIVEISSGSDASSGLEVIDPANNGHRWDIGTEEPLRWYANLEGSSTTANRVEDTGDEYEEVGLVFGDLSTRWAASADRASVLESVRAESPLRRTTAWWDADSGPSPTTTPGPTIRPTDYVEGVADGTELPDSIYPLTLSP